MGLPVPHGLSPSKVESFTSCGLAFRFSAVERLPEPPTPQTTKGTLVHRALELLLDQAPAERTEARALDLLDQAADELAGHPDWTGLRLDDTAEAALLDDAERLVRNYFRLEDPRRIHPIGLELRLEAEMAWGQGRAGLEGAGQGERVLLRGIIDRLELDADGELVVTDYKTGKAPSQTYERGKLGGVNFYAYLCEHLFGRRPARVQLLYLADPVCLVSVPSEQSVRFLPKKVGAVWSAVVKACATGDFRPRPGPLCSWCSFQRWCPSFGGQPHLARFEYRDWLAGQDTLELTTAP